MASHLCLIRIEARGFVFCKKALTDFLAEALGSMARSSRLPYVLEVSLLLTGNSSMRALNRRFRNMDRPTDVLSFPLLNMRNGSFDPAGMALEIDPGTNSLCLGDIVVAMPVCKKQALEQGHPPVQELERLILHGLVHLFGYDHERSSEDEAIMQKKEKYLLQSVKNRLIKDRSE